MRRSLPFLLAGLVALVAQPAMANQMVVRGSVPHHHHAFFHHRNNHIQFLSPTTAPFFFPPTSTFTLASPFIAQPLPFSTWPGGWGSGAFAGGFGYGALGDVGGFPAASAEPRVIVVAMPAASATPRRPEDERPTVEQTASGVTIIRGPGAHTYAP